LFFSFVSVWNLASPPFACCICCCFDFGIAHQQKANGYEWQLRINVRTDHNSIRN
jgi:hypothetical protein